MKNFIILKFQNLNINLAKYKLTKNDKLFFK